MGVPPKKHTSIKPLKHGCRAARLAGRDAEGEEVLKIEAVAHFDLMSSRDISGLRRSHPLHIPPSTQCLPPDQGGNQTRCYWHQAPFTQD